MKQWRKFYLFNRANCDWKMVPENLSIPGPHLRVRPIQIVGGKGWTLSLLLNSHEVLEDNTLRDALKKIVDCPNGDSVENCHDLMWQIAKDALDA